jgi:hypothetical protein
MYASERLTDVFESAEEIPFDDSSKLVFFSDCHRGDNSWSDDLAHNQTLFWYALKRYYEDGFTTSARARKSRYLTASRCTKG